MGHIPGPWDVVESPSLLHVETSIDNTFGAGVHVCSLTKAKAADARLIAAAPELLAACKAILAEFSEWEGPEEGEDNESAKARNQSVRAYEACRAAIAKAEGK